MSKAFVLILIHQILVQGMFLAKNAYLRRRIELPIRGNNREAMVATLFFVLFILASLALAAMDTPIATIPVADDATLFSLASVVLLISVVIGAATLVTMKDSWRVGVVKEQTTPLITHGIFRYSRNPYFTSYMLMFAAYTILLQNLILLVLSLINIGLIHWMVRREECYLSRVHHEIYRRYMERTPRYFLL